MSSSTGGDQGGSSGGGLRRGAPVRAIHSVQQQQEEEEEDKPVQVEIESGGVAQADGASEAGHRRQQSSPLVGGAQRLRRGTLGGTSPQLGGANRPSPPVQVGVAMNVGLSGLARTSAAASGAFSRRGKGGAFSQVKKRSSPNANTATRTSPRMNAAAKALQRNPGGSSSAKKSVEKQNPTARDVEFLNPNGHDSGASSSDELGEINATDTPHISKRRTSRDYDQRKLTDSRVSHGSSSSSQSSATSPVVEFRNFIKKGQSGGILIGGNGNSSSSSKTRQPSHQSHGSATGEVESSVAPESPGILSSSARGRSSSSDQQRQRSNSLDSTLRYTARTPVDASTDERLHLAMEKRLQIKQANMDQKKRQLKAHQSNFLRDKEEMGMHNYDFWRQSGKEFTENDAIFGVINEIKSLEELFEFEHRLQKRKNELLQDVVYAKNHHGPEPFQAAREEALRFENMDLVSKERDGNPPHRPGSCQSGHCVLDGIPDNEICLDFSDSIPGGHQAPGEKMFSSAQESGRLSRGSLASTGTSFSIEDEFFISKSPHQLNFTNLNLEAKTKPDASRGLSVDTESELEVNPARGSIFMSNDSAFQRW